MTADAPPADDAPDRFRVQLGTTAAVAVLFLVLRMLAVAHWDWRTVAAIGDTFDFSDSFPIAFGTIAGQPVLTGVLVAVLLPIVLMRLVWPSDAHKGWVTVSAILGAATLVTIALSMTLTFGNWWTFIGAAAVGAAITGARLAWRSGTVHDLVTGMMRSVGVIATVGVLILAAVDDTPWMSAERITTPHGVIDGYVLDAQPGFLHVLTEDREVLILPDDDVLGRELA